LAQRTKTKSIHVCVNNNGHQIYVPKLLSLVCKYTTWKTLSATQLDSAFRDSTCHECCAFTRVTRLGEFSPFGWLFTLGRFIENYRSSPNFSSPCTQFHGKIHVSILTKNNSLGYFWGDFFHENIWSPWPS
jgi:hypothetical protein